MTPSLSDLSHSLLDAARKAGAEAADALAVSGTALSIEIRKGALEQAERSEGVEIGLRVLVGRRQACVSASDTSSSRDDQALAERAVAMAREAPEDPTVGWPIRRNWRRAGIPGRWTCADRRGGTRRRRRWRPRPAPPKPPPWPPGITQVEASASLWPRALHLAATNGFSGRLRPQFHGRCRRWPLPAQGHRDAAGLCRRGPHMPPTCPRRRRDRRGAPRARAWPGWDRTKPPTGTYPVVYDERVAASLVGHLLSAINGTSIARGVKLGARPAGPAGAAARAVPGRRPAPPADRLVLGPSMPRGCPPRRRVLCRTACCTGWVLDLATGRKLGMPSTANAIARNTSAPPSPSTTAIIDLTQGTASREDLLKQMGTGLLVTSMIGSTINPTTGDYSRGAAGFWVENGQICGLSGARMHHRRQPEGHAAADRPGERRPGASVDPGALAS
jgi:PmbA protein